jgi:DNA-directed RNA polymerase subunit RPC12/RpoP
MSGIDKLLKSHGLKRKINVDALKFKSYLCVCCGKAFDGFNVRIKKTEDIKLYRQCPRCYKRTHDQYPLGYREPELLGVKRRASDD